MKRLLFIIAVFALALSMTACGKAPKEEKAAPAVEEQKAAPAEGQPQADKATEEQKAAPAAEQQAEGAEKGAEKAADKTADEPAEEDPDDEGGTGRGASDVDKEKLAKAYEEIYCAQKKGEMEKILDIYKNYGFQKPADFTATWIEAAKDTAWVTRIAHEVSGKCK